MSAPSGLDSVLASFLPPQGEDDEGYDERYSYDEGYDEGYDEEYEEEEDFYEEDDERSGGDCGDVTNAEATIRGSLLPAAPRRQSRVASARPGAPPAFEEDDTNLPNPLGLKPRPYRAGFAVGAFGRGRKPDPKRVLVLPAHREVVSSAPAVAEARLSPTPLRFVTASSACLVRVIVASVGHADVAAWRGAGGDADPGGFKGLGGAAVCAVVAVGTNVPRDTVGVGEFLLLRSTSALAGNSSINASCERQRPPKEATVAAAPTTAPAAPPPAAATFCPGCFSSLLVIADVTSALADSSVLCRMPDWLLQPEVSS